MKPICILILLLYIQIISQTDSNVADFKVNKGFINNNTSNSAPAVSVNSDGTFLVVWVEEDLRSSDIYAQRFSSLGVPIESNFIINDDTVNAFQEHPSIAISVSGGFVITWRDERNNRSDIYAQRYNNEAEPIGKNFIVNNDTTSTWNCEPTAVMDDSSNFAIVWTYIHHGITEIAMQRFSKEGIKLGENISVNDNKIKADHFSPSIAILENGDYLIVSVAEPYSADVFVNVNRFSQNGERIEYNFKVNDQNSTVPWYATPSVSSKNSNYIITWVDERFDTEGDIFAQRYSSNGNTIGNNFKVNDDNETAFQRSPSISVDEEGNSIIVWTDLRNVTPGIFAQRYSVNGVKLDTNFRITNTGESEQWEPTVKLKNNRIYNSWLDNRTDSSYNVLANILNWNNPVPVGISNQIITGIPNSFILYQNYPNPFNPTTTIKYSIPTDLRYEIQDVRLIVYDILGREVTTLVNQKQSPGNYEVTLSALGGQIPSGVYFYQLTAGASTNLSANKANSATGFVETKKMILLR